MIFYYFYNKKITMSAFDENGNLTIRKDDLYRLANLEMMISQIQSGEIECPKKYEQMHFKNGWYIDCGYFSCDMCGKCHHKYMKNEK